MGWAFPQLKGHFAMTRIFAARSSLIAAVIASGAALAFATPAAAADVAGTSNAQRTTAAPRETAARQDGRRICVQEAFTGTRITRRVCRTAAEWEATEGYVPR